MKVVRGMIVIGLIGLWLGCFLFDYRQYQAEKKMISEGDTIFLSNDYLPSLQAYEEYYVDSHVLENLEKMKEAALKEGISLKIQNAYLKNQSQIARYYEKLNAYLQEGRNLNEAQSILKQEGMSQEQFDYQTGLAIDFRDIQMPSNNEAMWQWLALNGAQYGFIVRYPSDKEAITNVKSNPWHFRYVGITVATEMQEHNECLEEYLERRNQDGNLKSSGSM